jgi:hypothetical protein
VERVGVARVQSLHRVLRGAEEERPVDLVEARPPAEDRRGDAPRCCRSRASLGDLRHAPHEEERGEHEPRPTPRRPCRRATVSPKHVRSTKTSLRGATLTSPSEVADLGHVPRDEEEQRRERRHRHVGDERRERRGSRGGRRGSERRRTRSGDRAPARMFVAVRASAPVAAIPPKNGATMLPIAEPTSSALGSCFVPVMPSAMTAERSDSIAPSIAIANAAGKSSRTSAKERVPAPRGGRRRRDGRDARDLDAVDHRVEAGADRGDVEGSGRERCEQARARRRRADRDERRGTRFVRRAGIAEEQRERRRPPRRDLGTARGPRALHSAATFSTYGSGIFATERPKTSLIWSVAMTVAMPVVNPVVTGYGMNSIRRPRRASPHRDEEDAGHEPGRQQPREAVLGDDGREDDDERRGRPGDLELAAAEERHHEARDDRRVEPVLGRHADRDRERHRQRGARRCRRRRPARTSAASRC